MAWLGLAAGAAVLNTLNDYFLDEVNILFRSYIFPLWLILLLMAGGYGLMGYDYLIDGFYAINHFRHFLTTGVFGLSIYMVMVVVATIHTGRRLETNRWVDVGVGLILLATALRTLIPLFPEEAQTLYLNSSFFWGLAFILYLYRFYPWLSQPRADGLPG